MNNWRDEKGRWIDGHPGFSTGNKRKYPRNVGEDNGRRKLTWKEVEDIRLYVEYGNLQKDVAEEFGVSKATVSQIVNKITWKGKNTEELENAN